MQYEKQLQPSSNAIERCSIVQYEKQLQPSGYAIEIRNVAGGNTAIIMSQYNSIK